MAASTGSSVRISLEQIKIASPCSARWEDMTGDERSRMCSQCGMRVHNVAGMTREEAERFLEGAVQAAANGADVCVRLYKRRDGTVMTKNCPVGVAGVRHRAWTGLRRVLAVASVVVVACLALKREEARAEQNAMNGYSPFDSACRSVRPFSWISERLGQEGPRVVQQIVMGRMRPPPPPTPMEHAKGLMDMPREEESE